MEDIFDLNCRNIHKKAQDILFKNIFDPSLEEGVIREGKNSKKTKRIFMRCRVRSKHDIPDAMFALCKVINDICEAGSLAGASGSVFFFRKEYGKEESDSGLLYYSSTKSKEPTKEIEIGLRLHVFATDYEQIKNWYFYDFETTENGTPCYFPKNPSELKCVCGVVIIYGEKTYGYMHSLWCPMYNKEDK